MSAQFDFLNTLRRERRLVVVYLIGGTRLQGRIASFDQQGLLLETKSGMVLCAQDQVSTVGRDVPRALLRGLGRSPGETRQPDRPIEARPQRPMAQVEPAVDGHERAIASNEPDHHDARAGRSSGVAPVVTQKLRRKITVPELQAKTVP